MTFLGSLHGRGSPRQRGVAGRAPHGAARPGRRGAAWLAHRARRLVWRHRVLLAAICCGLAATSAVEALRPAPPPSSRVLVTTRTVDSGDRLGADDVALREIATSVAPPAALGDRSEAVGLTAVVPLPAGAALHPGVLSDGGVLSSAPDGTVVVPVTLADDGVAALLRPGDRVDLLAPGAAGSVAARPGPAPAGDPEPAIAYLARRALVLPTPARRTPGDDAAGLLGGGAAPPPVTLVAVDPAEAPDLSAIAGMGAVSAILVR